MSAPKPKKKRIRPSSGQRIGRMSCRVYYANTIHQALQSMAIAEGLYRTADIEKDRKRRAELIDEAKGRMAHVARFCLDYLVDNKYDVVEMVEQLLIARDEEDVAA